MKYFLTIALLLVLITAYFIFRPDPDYVVKNIEISSPDAETVMEEGPQEEDHATRENDQRVAIMQERFAELEKTRRNLERRLARMKAVLWGVKFTPEQNQEITKVLQSGYALLKNPKLLGAYHSIEEINQALAKVNFTYNKVVEIEQMAREMKKEAQANKP